MDNASRRKWRYVWIGLAVVTVAALATFAFLSPTFKGWIESVTDWAADIMKAHPVAGSVVFFLLSAIGSMLAFASSLVLVPPANEVWGKPVTFLLLWGGWTAGAVAAYFIGYFARPLLYRLVSRQKLREYGDIVSKRMKLWAAILLCIAAPSELPGYLFGGLHYPFWKFIAAISVAEAVYALGVIIAGESLMEAKPATVAAAVGILIAVAVGAGMLLRKQRKRTS
jgi:uncharacterized membrane protein YdjX (TVP38/TMEM64 family)